MAQDCSDDDDYMSDAFLAKCADTRPGLVSKSVARRYETEAKHRQSNAVHREQNKSRNQLESEHRDEGLKQAIASDNKGFKLLEKMGYKTGMAIGKKGNGSTEPIPIAIKTSRGGLGEESERKRRVAEQRAMRAAMARKRQKHEEEWQQSVKAKVACRESERDLNQSQKVCEQLDTQHGYEHPERKFYWPPELLPHKAADEDEDDDDDDADDEEEDEDEDDYLPTEDKLQILTHYLRSTYWYCVWCGTAYNDEADMQSNCPGDCADDHR